MADTPNFFDIGVRDEQGRVDFSRPARPEFHKLGADDQEVLDFMTSAGKTVISDPTFADPGKDFDIDLMRSVLLSRVMEAEAPTALRPGLGELTPEQHRSAKIMEKRRVLAAMNALDEAQRTRAELAMFRKEYPELSKSIDNTEEWEEKLKGAVAGAARKGVRALDFLFRNIDRPRGAIASYELALQHGASYKTAIRRAKAAFVGSDKGWTWYPHEQAPSFKEVLVAAGMDDELTTSMLGLGMDVLIDPVNLLGVGAARKGVEIGAHQVLNKYGRQMHGRLLRKYTNEFIAQKGVASEVELGVEYIEEAARRANAEMRTLINSGPDTAAQYLDIGGLKIAGFTLPGTAYLRKKEILRGGVEQDYVAESVARMFGRGMMQGADRLGAVLQAEGRTGIEKRVGQFMELLPWTLRETGRIVGLTFSRTSPMAGKEYKYFKQTEYYDKLGLAEHRIRDDVRQMFEGVEFEDLEALPFIMEAQKEGEFLQQLAVRKSRMYADNVARGLEEYRAKMDGLLLDEVERGFIQRSWQDKPEVMMMFRRWMANKGQLPGLDPEMHLMFQKVRIPGYVSHIYHNMAKVHKLAPPPRLPNAPSIVEPFTEKRIVDSLEKAVSEGLVPEKNLAVIAATRMLAHSRAIVTHDFLSGAVEAFGANRAGIMGVARRAAMLAGNQTPEPLWKEVLNMRSDVFGKVALPVDKQVQLAKALALTANVPLRAVAKLDDVAISEFLRNRLRVVTAGKSYRVWKRYVEIPSQKGMYDGYALAPARTEADAVAKARDMVDPSYPAWGFVKAGGKADPDKLGDMLFPLPIVEDLERLTVKPSGEFQRIVYLYDKLNYWWKRNVTVIWPAFHFRNKMTNVLNSVMDIGIGGILDRGAMTSIVRGGDGVLKLANGMKLSYSQVRQLARRHGVVQVTYRRADVSAIIQDVVRGETKASTQLARRLGVKLPGREELLKRGELLGPTQITAPITLRNLQRAGEETGMLIENSDRMQLFVKSLQRGMSPEQAARRVKDFLFDYDDISRVEKTIIRRFFNPFWTWTRKNIALQAKLVTRTPGRFVVPSKFARALSVERDDAMRSDVERELLPRYLSDKFGIRLEASGAMSKWLMGADLPHDELDRLWQGKWRKTMLDWMAGIQPFARDIFETAVQKDFYKGQKRVEFIRGTKVYEQVGKLQGTKVGNWLGMRKRTYREQETVEVDSGKWQLLMWMTAWQLSRAYTTFGKLTDKKQGSVTQRLFNFLTGLRIEDTRPQEELRRMVDAALHDDDKGLLKNLRQKWRQQIDYFLAQGMDVKDAEKFLFQLKDAAQTPEEGAELSVEDTDEWFAAED